MRRVRSPYVAEVLDADVTGKFPYIVTRYVPGHTLDDVVRQQGPLPPWALERLARGLAAGAGGRARGRRRAPRPQAGQRDAARRRSGRHRLRHRARRRRDQAHPDRHVHGHARLPGARGDRGPAQQRGVRRALLGRAPSPTPPPGGRRSATASFENIFYRIVQGNADLAGIPGPLAQLVSAALSRDPRQPPHRGVADRPVRVSRPGRGPPVLRGATTQAPVARRLAAAYGAPGAAASATAPRAPRHGGPGGYGGAGRNAAAPAAPHAPRLAAADQARRLRRPATAGPVRSPARRPAPARRGRAVRLRPGRRVCARVLRRARPGWCHRRAAPGPCRPRRRAGAQRAQPSRLLGLATMVIAIAVSVMLPVAGTIGALAVITLLRAGDRAQSALTARRSVRGPAPPTSWSGW